MVQRSHQNCITEAAIIFAHRYGLNSSSESSNTPTLNIPESQNSHQRDSENPDFDFINQAFEEFPAKPDEEFRSELENSIRERCANSPLHIQLFKYLNLKISNLLQEKDSNS